MVARRDICPLCKREITGRCRDCVMGDFMALYVGGWREGALEKLIKDYKYEGVWAAGEALAEILDAALGDFAEEAIVVPLPTIQRHVRERGLDHTLRLARKLAKRRGWKCEQVLVRAADTVQVGAKAAERETQAQRAYAARGRLDAEKTYVLLDDVWTTGASMRAAAKVMREVGAKKLVGVVLATGRPAEF